MAKKDQWGKTTSSEKTHDIFTTHIFRLEKMRCCCTTDLDPKPFDFLCWGPLMSSPLGLPCKQKPPTCEVQSSTLWAENWQGGFLYGMLGAMLWVFCWVLNLERKYLIPQEMHVFDIQFGFGTYIFVTKKDRSIPIDAKWGNMKEISYRFQSNLDGSLLILDTQSVN